MYFPRDIATPALRAAATPARGQENIFNLESDGLSKRAVLSVEPSSTMMSSKLLKVWSRTDWTASAIIGQRS